MYMCIQINYVMCVCTYIYIYREREREIMVFRGLGSSIIFILTGWIPRPAGKFPESLSS